MREQDDTLQRRFNAAVREIRKGGVRVVRNARNCTFNHAEGEPLIWHYGGGDAFGWANGLPTYQRNIRRWDSRTQVRDAYFYASYVSEDCGNQILATFAKHGVIASWTHNGDIVVNFVASADEPLPIRRSA